jgi:hypothetical protein
VVLKLYSKESAARKRIAGNKATLEKLEARVACVEALKAQRAVRTGERDGGRGSETIGDGEPLAKKARVDGEACY